MWNSAAHRNVAEDQIQNDGLSSILNKDLKLKQIISEIDQSLSWEKSWMRGVHIVKDKVDTCDTYDVKQMGLKIY